ncbi:MAG: universal stress protein [Eubacteriales bacterium]|nr:universal stress protein [Eubacteriales bacterium]
MKKILVPIDGSKHADLAMEKAKEFAEMFGSSIVLLHVNDFHQHMFNYNAGVEEHFIELFDQMSDNILEEGAKKLAKLGGRVETVKLEGGVATKIIDYANVNDFDLVIIGSHGKGALHNFLMGSVAHKIIMHVNKPVLVVRDPNPQDIRQKKK